LLLLGSAESLRIMTFNVWNSGRYIHNGLGKIATQIKSINPDAVALQEVRDKDHIEKLVAQLGAGWSGVIHCNLDTAILSRHTIVAGTYAQTDRGMHVRIQLSGSERQVSVWSMHLEYRSYGPYAANNKRVTSELQILAGEMPTTGTSRVQDIVQLLQQPTFIDQINNSKNVPVIVAGDFNVPSDEDWIDANRNEHGGWAIEWPTTKLLRNTSGMRDSFRELYTDPVADPGVTWSVFKYQSEWDYMIPEPEDRIDFIFFRGALRPFSSFTYAGRTPIRQQPLHAVNDWPSDHYSVVTDFEEVSRSEPAPPMKAVDSSFIVKRSTRSNSQQCVPKIVHAFVVNKLDRRRRHRPNPSRFRQ
ncbi:hypothetical protein PFISCL1PPCAC_15974, partial [Pristionchus fissidentatus]